jgi:glycosyltransferase involved in cell wall biosynthesis
MPAYNEEANVEPMVHEVLQAVQPVASDLEIIVVDDGSRDRTADKVRALEAQYPGIVRLVQHPRNQGYGAALYTGFLSAKKDWVFLTDCDRQFDVREITKLLPYTDRADLVIGYRAKRQDPFHRRLNGWGWNFVVALFFGYTARDVDCAFKLFKREVLDEFHILSRGATLSAEFLIRSRRAGCKIVEVPVTHLPRTAGSPTGARLHVILRAFRELFSLRLAMWRGQ